MSNLLLQCRNNAPLLHSRLKDALYTQITGTLAVTFTDMSQLETETATVCWKQITSFRVLKYHSVQVKCVLTSEKYTVLGLDFLAQSLLKVNVSLTPIYTHTTGGTLGTIFSFPALI